MTATALAEPLPFYTVIESKPPCATCGEGGQYDILHHADDGEEMVESTTFIGAEGREEAEDRCEDMNRIYHLGRKHGWAEMAKTVIDGRHAPDAY